MMDFGAKVATFVVDSNINHFGYVGALDFLNIADEGIDFKYSYIHWHKDGVNRFDHKDVYGSRFNVSEFKLAYNFRPDFVRYKTKVYAAYLYNHEAKANKYTDHKKCDDAFYFGFAVGEIKRPNDWAIDINYQWVEPQAVKSEDVRGIGRDNPWRFSMYKRSNTGINGDLRGIGGYANYKGYELNGKYALTENLILNASYKRVHQCKRINKVTHRARWIEVDAIYAF